MLKKTTWLVMCIIIFLLFIPVGAEFSTESTSRKDWWPMHHHNIHNTGFSRSKAPETNTLLWTNSTDDRIHSSPAVIHNRVYVGSDDQHLYCLHAKTGETIWRFPTDSYIRTSPAVWQNKVYFGADNGKVYCIRADNAELLWTYQTESWWIYSSPIVYNNRVYIGGQNGKLHCLDAERGTIVWSYQTGYWVDSTPAIYMNKVYVGSHDGFLYCLNAQTGEFLWSFDTSEYEFLRQIASSPSIYQNKVIFNTADGLVFCLDASTGEKLWSTKAGLGGERTSPAIAYGRVYIGSYIVDMQPPYPLFGKVYCLDISTGEHLWNYTAESTVHFCSVADNKVYFGISNFWVEPDYIYCIDAFSGKFIWKYHVGDYIMSTPVIADENLYVTSCDGSIYCFSTRELPN